MVYNEGVFKRAIYKELWDELSQEKPMVFISGPRQTGKTTFARQIITRQFKNNIYFNWDIIKDKKRLIEDPAFFQHINRVDSSTPLIIFDELHKYKNWKNYLKGIYDEFAGAYKFLISGSGRLDIYQKGGDSLAGRYLQLHLFPFTIAELSAKRRTFAEFIKKPLDGFDINSAKHTSDLWQALSEVGGFPEPFIKGKKTFWNKWSQAYARQILQDDIRSVIDIKNVDTVEILFSLLPSKIGSPLSINNIAQDLQVAFETVKNWLMIFERFYLVFQVSPWTNKVSRAITKEKKNYLFNYPLIQQESARFENMVALELLRAVYNWNEHGYGRFSLHYIRNKEKTEVDFVIADNNKPVLLLETKLFEDAASKSLLAFQSIFNIPAAQLVNKEGVFKYIRNGPNKALIITAHRWLSRLP
jgi:predicted AAA+ superfamily ATPase